MPQLESEKIILEAPFSFVGSCKRIWRLSDNFFARLFVLLPLVMLAWAFVLVWYMVFGLWVVPYRILRRHQRRNRKLEAQHRELLDAVRGNPSQ